MAAEKVTLGVQVEGAEQAEQKFGKLVALMEQMNPSSGASDGGRTTKPAGAPSIVPDAGSALGGYAPAINPPSIAPSVAEMNGVLASSLSFVTKPSPPPVAPDPLKGHSTAAPPVLPPSSNGGGTGNSGNGGVLRVEIVGSVPLAFVGGSGGGGNGGGYGAGGGAGGSSAGGGQSGGAPAYPYGGGFDPHGAGGGMSGLWRALASDPTPVGLLQTVMRAVPLGPAAMTAAGVAFADYGMGAYSAATQPRFQTDLGILSQQASGQYVPPILAAAMRRSADIRGTQGFDRALLSPLDAVTGGMYGKMYDLSVGRPLEEAATLAQAQGQDDLIRQRLSALTGSPVASSAASGTAASLTSRRADLMRLGVAGVFGNLLSGNPLGAFGSGLDVWHAARMGGSVDQAKAAAASDTGDDTFRLHLATAAAPFGPGAAGFDAKAFLDRHTHGSFTRDQVSQAGAGLLAYDLRAGNADIAAPVLAGRGPDTNLDAALRRMIGQGDLSSILGIQSLIRDAGQFKSAMRDAFAQTTLLNTAIPIAAAHVSLAQANVAFDQATGVGFRGVAGDIGAIAGVLGSEIALKRQALAKMTNPLDRAHLQAEIRGMEAQQAGLRQSAVMAVFSGEGVMNQARSLGAGNELFSAMYGGTHAGVDAAYGLQSRAGLAEARRLEDMSRSSFISPEQRELYKQQARQKRLESTVGLDRERSSYDFGITTAQIGVAGARASAVLTQARLYSDPAGIYAADLGAAGVTQRQIGAVRARLSDPASHLSEGERLDLQARSISLLSEFNASLENSKRSFLSLDVSVTQTRQSIIAQQGNRSFLLGAGGGAAYGIGAANVVASDNSIAKQRRVLANLPPGSPQYATEQDKLEGMLTGREQTRLGIANTPLPIDLRMQEMNAQGQFNIMQKSYLPYGDTRRYFEDMMGAKGRELKEFASLRAQAKKGGYYDKAFEEQLRSRELGTVSSMADLQNQLSEGWEGRLISSVVGLPSRGAFSTAGFTRFESSKFLQNLTPGFGFSGAGGMAARDNWMFRGPHLYGSTIGALQRPEGFMATAMSGTNIAAMTGTLKAAPTEVRVILEDHRTTVVANGKSTTVNHPGGNAGVIQGLNNGSLELTRSSHVASASHQ